MDGVTQFKVNAWQKPKKAKSYASLVNASSSDFLQVASYVQWLCEDFTPKTTRVLDVGCGTGALTTPLSRAGFSVTGVDVSQAMLDQIAKSRRVVKQVGDVLDSRLGLPSKFGEFDAVVSRWLLPHFPNWRRILSNMSDVLANRGVMYVDFPNPEHYRLALQLSGNSETSHGYSFQDDADPSSFYRAPSSDEVADAAAAAGCKLVGVRPASFLAASALPADPDGLKGWVGSLMASARSRRSLIDVDQELNRRFPVALSGLLIYKMQRC